MLRCKVILAIWIIGKQLQHFVHEVSQFKCGNGEQIKTDLKKTHREYKAHMFKKHHYAFQCKPSRRLQWTLFSPSVHFSLSAK